MTILGAKLVRAGGAGEGRVGALPEALRMQEDEQPPHQEGQRRQPQQAPAVHAGEEQKRREHHQVIPVEDAAGGAAAVFHKPHPEGAPEQNADKIADIKCNRDKQEHSSSDNACEIERAYGAVEDKPHKSDENSVSVGLDYEADKFFVASLHIVFERLECALEKFLRSGGPISFGGNKLHDHVHHPNDPHKVEKAQAVKNMKAVHNIELLGQENKQQRAYDKNRAAHYKALMVKSAEIGKELFFFHLSKYPCFFIPYYNNRLAQQFKKIIKNFFLMILR